MKVLFDGLACFATLYYLFALWCVVAFFSRKPFRLSNWTPPVSILKPVKGLDEAAFENFVSFCRQDYPDYEVLFGVGSKEDPAVPVIQRLIQAHPELDIQLVVLESMRAVNQKVGILDVLTQRARHDLLVISDSDVRVPPNYLKEIVSPFQEPKIGMVTCLYRISGSKNLPAALESMIIHLDFFPAVLVAERLEGLGFGLGATMAITRSALLTIGGFKRIADYLADDYLLGRLIHQAGYRVLLSTVVVDIIQEKLSTMGTHLQNLPAQGLFCQHSHPRRFLQHDLYSHQRLFTSRLGAPVHHGCRPFAHGFVDLGPISGGTGLAGCLAEFAFQRIYQRGDLGYRIFGKHCLLEKEHFPGGSRRPDDQG